MGIVTIAITAAVSFVVSILLVLVAILLRQLRDSRSRLRSSTDAWGQIQRSFEREIELHDRLGNIERANQIRRDLAEQHEAWRAQQAVSGLAPREIMQGAQSSLTEDDLDRLRNLLVHAVPLKPGSLSARDLFLRGNSYFNLERYNDALADYNRSLELRPDDPTTLTNRGVTLHHLELYDDALADYNRSLELRPDNPATLYNRGYVLDELGRYNDALADYNRSLELRPDDPTTLMNRAVTLEHLERFNDALADYNRSLELRPDDPTTTYNIACNFSLRGQYQESLEWLGKAIALDSKYRSMAQGDDAFALLRGDPVFGPKFRDLVGGDTDN